MQYNFLRLFLQRRERPPLLEMAGSMPKETTRQEYLGKIFNQRINFTHRNKPFVYVPIGNIESDTASIILGRVGRLRTSTENQPPEQGFEETIHTSWRAANLLLDSRDFRDGQKVAIQSRQDVGKPLPIAASMVEYINSQNPDSGWLIAVNLITEKSSFWDVYKSHKGEITEVVFSFNTPNVLKIRSQLNADLQQASDDHNAKTVTETLGNPDGNLVLEGQDVEDSLDYISEGGGSVKLKSGREVLYDSEKNEKSVSVSDDAPISKENKSIWEKLFSDLFKGK